MKYLNLLLLLLSACSISFACSTAPVDQHDASPMIRVGTTTIAVVHHMEPTAVSITPIISVHFSPNGGCTDMVVKLIESANIRVHLMAYSFTSQPVIAALIGAKHDGRDVVLVLDKSDARNPKLKDLRAAGIPVYIDYKHGIMHQKVTIVDNDRLETGSFNYTAAAESHNAENCVRFDDVAGIVDSYEQNFQIHKGHAVALR